MGKLVRTEGPQALAAPESFVWQHLNLPLESDDGSPAEMVPVDWPYVRQLLEAAIGELAGRDGILGRCLIAENYELHLECFPRVIELPLPPLLDLYAVEYFDADGVIQEVPLDWLYVSGIGANSRAEISLMPGRQWPMTGRMPYPVRVAFCCGYGETSEEVPAPIRQAILERVASLYEFREAVTAGQLATIPHPARDALASYIDYRFR